MVGGLLRTYLLLDKAWDFAKTNYGCPLALIYASFLVFPFHTFFSSPQRFSIHSSKGRAPTHVALATFPFPIPVYRALHHLRHVE